ncbi:MAG: hypothetical protein M1814_004126 [Vezdaea aestivalis]|nr:MAG: hypothetical protein M1814_004126 [Vezdaea aestivalis]
MEFEVSYILETEQQFWEGALVVSPLAISAARQLEDILSVHCGTHELIDNALRSYLAFASTYREEYLQSEYDIAKCSLKLLESQLFESHNAYIRRQLLYGLLEDDDHNTLRFVVYFFLIDGRNDEATFEMMNNEGVFPRLVELIMSIREEDPGLHRMVLELLYEMSRIQRLSPDDLGLVTDGFISYLFQITEELSNDADDPYHYPIIRVLVSLLPPFPNLAHSPLRQLVLNEQYMVLAHSPTPPSPPLTNKLIKHLSLHTHTHKTLGSNIILLLNRETETSLQLLILKFLYLVFTTPPTYEYFYTNDLRVLVDVMMRNLLDLPDDAAALRHTYLRVLCPLLAHTQLRLAPHYKRDELRRVLAVASGQRAKHFAPVDPTTRRLVRRCESIAWVAGTDGAADGDVEGEGARELAKKALGMRLGGEAQESSLSVVEVAKLTEKPGVQTARRGVVNGTGKESNGRI